MSVSTLVRDETDIRPPVPNFPDSLACQLLEYSKGVFDAVTPDEVLGQLHAITSRSLHLNMFGAIRFPQKVMDWGSLKVGETVFLHGKVAKAWWEEWIRQVPHKLPVGFALAQMSLVPHSLTDALQIIQPIGVDRWGYELALKHGIRDAYLFPVGARWLLSFWSSKPVPKALNQPIKIVLAGAASFAVLRLDQLAGLVRDTAHTPSLTPRELAVLRLLSIGTPFRDLAQDLGLGVETVRTHLRKAQRKLGVRNRTQAVAEAIRQRFIL
ncbi:MAG TPA: LuxR C-terminal-related transcriptional regulator [Hyphomicrobiales bacterium]|nr:LuxR C-terminal-related transcriptional regulator [Hyphomicrobiales bacterium]